MENPLLSCPYLVKKRQFCQNYTILWANKVNRMPFFSDLSWKNHCSHAHIWSKKRPFSRKTHCSHAHILPEKRPFSQKHSALMSFFLIFHEKPPAFMPIFGQNNVNSVKTTLYYGPKKSMAKKKVKHLATILSTSWKYNRLLPKKYSSV